MRGRHFSLPATTVVLFVVVRSLCGVEPADTAERKTGRLTGRFVLATGVTRPLPVYRRGFATALLHEVEWLDETVLVADDRGIANVLVYAVGDGFDRDPVPRKLPPGSFAPVPEKPFVTLALEPWRFEPHVLPLRTNHSLRVVNNSELSNNTKIEPPDDDSVNPLITPGRDLHFHFTTSQTLPVPVSSSIIVWMHAYILPLDHPYFAVSRPDGTFEIKDLPVGREIEFQVWHEKKGSVVSKQTGAGRFRLKIEPGENKLGTVEFVP